MHRCPYEFIFKFPKEWFLKWREDEVIMIYISRPRVQEGSKKKKSQKAKEGFYYRKRYCVFYQLR